MRNRVPWLLVIILGWAAILVASLVFVSIAAAFLDVIATVEGVLAVAGWLIFLSVAMIAAALVVAIVHTGTLVANRHTWLTFIALLLGAAGILAVVVGPLLRR